MVQSEFTILGSRLLIWVSLPGAGALNLKPTVECPMQKDVRRYPHENKERIEPWEVETWRHAICHRVSTRC